MKEFLNTKEAAELLDINEKKIYSLAASGKIPGTMVTGKWLFPHEEIERFIKSKSNENVIYFTNKKGSHSYLLIAGSDDPSLNYLGSSYHETNTDSMIYFATVGSLEGIKLLKSSSCDICFSHLYDSKNDLFNFTYAYEYFNPDEVVIINLFKRKIGFISKSNDIRNFKDIIDKKLQFINRQTGSGIRQRIDYLIENEGIEKEKIIGFNNCASTHFEVGFSILKGKVDAGICSKYIADSLNLNFTEIADEYFDIIAKKETYFEKNIQNLIKLTGTDKFKNNLKNNIGYNTEKTGELIYPD